MLKDFSKEKFDVLIQAGQSNSQGCGYGTVETPFAANENIWQLNQNMTISLAQEEVWGNNAILNFSLPFAAKYVEKGLLKDSRKLLIIRAAVGGTGFLDNQWGMKDPLYLQMMEMVKTALDLNSENRLVGFIWHQGETDASLNASYETHYNNLISLIKSVKSQFSCENLPFIAADFVQDWKSVNLEICAPIISAIKDICTAIGNADFVETAELKSNAQDNGGDDTIHFSRNALMQLGEMYFNAYYKLING